MSAPSVPPQSDGGQSGRPGRKPGPISDGVGPTHRAWLEPLRTRFLAGGLTISDLSERSGWAKSKISELLRGAGLYPRWEITHGLLQVLEIPTWPMRRLWMAAALEAHKKPDWIDGCIQKVALTTGPVEPPLEHQAFTDLNRDAYTAYARVFLEDQEAFEAVQETFDLLWLHWHEALASSDVVAFAWPVLRERVMDRAYHSEDGHPELTHAAFNTLALSHLTDDDARFRQIAESLALFRAISRLPAPQLDVMVLTHLLGLDHAAVADVLGTPIAAVHSTDRYARKSLTTVLGPQHDPGDAPA
ncbi:DNA-directed RNA polymerase specialized sigma24 family protein [Streptomyces sp. TLI_55]|uniref:sigma factor-like helix-turn-helix DNA-binding protein n=1 Tax=Streptomyces sp. TLI_55 TaxID=1938861 RepID=UPI000BDC5E70|nr:sigma factor-like helix-turn-helix DNA-binding protein [Streptomyces sp. TLI_55]SNX88699.1 DNA-directed RNA polymerase specialized sigma24 family protein [Streptomyces sp. TLI_55]